MHIMPIRLKLNKSDLTESEKDKLTDTWGKGSRKIIVKVIWNERKRFNVWKEMTDLFEYKEIELRGLSQDDIEKKVREDWSLSQHYGFRAGTISGYGYIKKIIF